MKFELLMDQQSWRGGGYEIDLESGVTVGEDTGGRKSNLSDVSSKNLLYRLWSGCPGHQLSDTAEKGGQSFISLGKASRVDESFVKNEVKLPGKVKEPKACSVEKKTACKLPKKPGSTRHPKPPRPPRGPSLNAADMMLAKKISELAILKRKRIERMKTLHKVKKERVSSMKGSLYAMVVTILFFVVIICQGFEE